MCNVLEVSESGYYRWLKSRNTKKRRELLSVEIKKILAEHPDNDNYGVPRIRIALRQKGIAVSERTVYRAMKEAGLLHKRRRPHGITKANTEIQDKENILKRDFTAEEPVKKLLTDISEIQCSDGKLYISPILDCFNGEIVALEMRDNMKKELCLDTIAQLKTRYGDLSGVIIHSDRGSQYTSEAFRKRVAQYGMIQSLSGTGHCFDNSRMESFFATLKKEKLYRMPTYKMRREQVKSIIFRYVFAYYNRVRIYTSNPMGLPPVKYREWTAEQQAA